MKINKITNINIENLNSIKETKKREEINLNQARSEPQRKISSQEETVQILSSEVIKKAVKKALSMPEIREEKVAEIKAKIESGTYNVSNKNIAKALIRNLLDEIA